MNNEEKEIYQYMPELSNQPPTNLDDILFQLERIDHTIESGFKSMIYLSIFIIIAIKIIFF